MKHSEFFNRMLGMALLTNMIKRRAKANNAATKNAGALIKGVIPYHGTGRSRTMKANVRKIKKRQRRRAFYNHLNKGRG